MGKKAAAQPGTIRMMNIRCPAIFILIFSTDCLFARSTVRMSRRIAQTSVWKICLTILILRYCCKRSRTAPRPYTTMKPAAYRSAAQLLRRGTVCAESGAVLSKPYSPCPATGKNICIMMCKIFDRWKVRTFRKRICPHFCRYEHYISATLWKSNLF